MSALNKKIADKILKKGPISFAEFMQLALYDDDFGYYSSGKVKIGKDGDFYTSPCVHWAFGKIISKFISKCFNELETQNFTILEIGAGKGYLALDILNSLKKSNSNLYNSVNYIVDELNPNHINHGKNLLKNHEAKIKWVNSNREELPNFSGVVISNELFDSLPFHRIVAVENELKEIFVDYISGKFIEIKQQLSNEKIKKYIKNHNILLSNEQQIEVNLNIEQIYKKINRQLEKGFILNIDYGSLSKNLFTPDKKRGTFKCFYQHSLNENPLINIGNQDITADINFSELIFQANNLGIKTIKYTTQGQFLVDWGILNIIEDLSFENLTNEIQREIFAIKNLFMPNLMGNKFKVLIQKKNVSIQLKDFYPFKEIQLSFGES